MDNSPVDIVLIGGGIMSATLGTYIQSLEPSWTINMYERLDKVAEESSNGWNNAGTGHAAFCEPNYTIAKNDGSIDISKAIWINESFEISRQFWSYLVKNAILNNPHSFINNVPHMSFVWGNDNVSFLRKRFKALQNSTLFRGMKYSEEPQLIKQWAPLIMDGRNTSQKIAATLMSMGTDVNFGEITQQLLTALQKNPNFYLYLHHNVVNLKRNSDKTWNVQIVDTKNGSQQKTVKSRHVFIGSGGASLIILQKSNIPEATGYAGFPVGGQFLVVTHPNIVSRHNAKVYGKTNIGVPPISMPHIDTRILEGKQILLFGPFATFSSKFLKHGSWFDLFHSLTPQNLPPMLHVAMDNFVLVKYLFSQLVMSDNDRLNALQEYYPEAKLKDWQLIQAGQRVQVIKKDIKKGGLLQFGTEVVSSADGSLAAILGASPGASAAAQIMLKLLNTMFKEQIATNIWQQKLREMIPSYGQKINGNLVLTNQIRRYTSDILGLTYINATPISR